MGVRGRGEGGREVERGGVEGERVDHGGRRIINQTKIKKLLYLKEEFRNIHKEEMFKSYSAYLI